jgi:hypothetical protein
MTQPEKPKSNHQLLEDAQRHYYGADTDQLRMVPAVTNPDVAHQIATNLERQITVHEAGTEGPLDPTTLARIALNGELQHARLAPGDFGEDATASPAYQMGIGVDMNAPRPPREEPPHLRLG